MAESREYPSLLRGLLPGPIDSGYTRAHARRGGRPATGPGQLVALLLGALLAGLLLGVAASDAAARAPGAEQARRGLVDDLRAARARTDELSDRSAQLRTELRQAQDEQLAGSRQGRATLDTVRRLELAAGAVAVTGPGLRITVADGPQRHGVLDRDLQLLVNSVWAAGAEAIALGGVRLHPLATVRLAGGAMLVDNRPVDQPYVFTAIGDPASLHTRLVQTDGYGRFATFAQVYGTTLNVEASDSLTLLAGAPAVATSGGNR
jgi:uncharacterized protein YlxW (UPF0749 family)